MAEHVVSIREDGRKFSLNVWKSPYHFQREKITVWFCNFRRANVSPSSYMEIDRTFCGIRTIAQTINSIRGMLAQILVALLL